MQCDPLGKPDQWLPNKQNEAHISVALKMEVN